MMNQGFGPCHHPQGPMQYHPQGPMQHNMYGPHY